MCVGKVAGFKPYTYFSSLAAWPCDGLPGLSPSLSEEEVLLASRPADLANHSHHMQSLGRMWD